MSAVTGAVSTKGRFKQCKDRGAYDLVSPGEVCTIDTAKKLGIYNPKTYFVEDGNYASLQTFNEKVDTDQNRTAERVCNASQDSATQMCAIEHGVGMVRKPGLTAESAPTCVAYGCPTGFEYERGACTKPLKDAVLTQRAFCDERWYDWYMIPNYHLNNRYAAGSNVGECYQPCNPGFLPNLITDPADSSSLDLFSEDDPGRCVPKDEYFYGKYQGTSDYCPLAWIHRIGVLPSTIAETLSNVYEASATDSVPNNRWRSLMDGRYKLADKLGKMSGGFLENVETPTVSMQAACSAPGYRTEERLRVAYGVCQDIKTDEEAFARRLGAELGDSADVQSNKIVLLKQACNALFCNPNDDSFSIVGADPICFDEVRRVVSGGAEEKEKEPPTIRPGLMFVGKVTRGSVKLVKILTILVLVGIVIWLIYKLVSWAWNKEGVSGKKVYDGVRRLFGARVFSESDETLRLKRMAMEALNKANLRKTLAEAMQKTPVA